MFELMGTPPISYLNPATGRNPQGGRSFFVREGSITGHITSSNDNEGTDPQFPLDDIQTALDKCVASMGDYIFVLYHSSIASAPLTIPVRTIHLIGCSSGSFNARNDLLSGGSADAINIDGEGRDLELAGFNVGAGSSYYGIETVANVGESGSSAAVMTRCHIHHCTFGFNAACLDGIHLDCANSCSIDNNIFGDFGQQLSTDGIYGNDITACVIAHNIFSRCTKGIHLGAPNGNWIFENSFYNAEVDNDTIGWAIDLDSGSHNQIWHNFAMDAGDDGGAGATYEPYVDASHGTPADMTNGWCMNYFGDTVDTVVQT